MLLVEQHLNNALRYADRVCLLVAGRIEFDGRPRATGAEPLVCHHVVPRGEHRRAETYRPRGHSRRRIRSGGLILGTEVIVERHDNRVQVIRLNRPHVKNAINAAVARGVAAAIDEAQAADEIRVVILTGSGACSPVGWT